MITTDTIPYTGSTYDPATGSIGLGPRVETDRAATWRLYASGSMLSGIISGSAGMGTSRLLDLIAHGAMSSGHTVVWHIDPQGGASSPALAEAADRSAISIRAARDLVRAVDRIVDVRCAYHNEHGLRDFTPSAERPGLLIVIDEFMQVAADRGVRATLDQLVSCCAKVGVAFVVGSSRPDLGDFGGSAHLRNNLAHNLVLLHHNTRLGLNRFGIDLEPADLPAIRGYGYHLQPDSDGTAHYRAATFRAAHLGDGPRDIKRWFDSIPTAARATLEPESAAAARS